MFAVSLKKMFKQLEGHKELQITLLIMTHALLTDLACSTTKLQR
jgi:hypothetical protein